MGSPAHSTISLIYMWLLSYKNLRKDSIRSNIWSENLRSFMWLIVQLAGL